MNIYSFLGGNRDLRTGMGETLKPATNMKNINKMPIHDFVGICMPTGRHNTSKGYRCLQSHLEASGLGCCTVGAADALLCRRFADYLLSRMKPNSARAYLQRLHGVLHSAVRIGCLQENPMPPLADLMPRFVPQERAFLTFDEVRRLEDTPCPHRETRLAFLFSCHTGLRISDIETLQWDDTTEQMGHLIVAKIQVKTGREVRIPLDLPARAIIDELKRQKHNDGRVFHMMSRTMIGRDLRHWGTQAGLEKSLSFHVARHTFATLMVSQLNDIYVVSQLCGHANVRTTEIYARLLDESRFRAIERLEALWRNGKRDPLYEK